MSRPNPDSRTPRRGSASLTRKAGTRPLKPALDPVYQLADDLQDACNLPEPTCQAAPGGLEYRLDIAWRQAPGVRRRVLAHARELGLHVTTEQRHTLIITGTQSQAVMTTRPSAGQVAIAVAVAAETADRALATGDTTVLARPAPPGALTVAQALRRRPRQTSDDLLRLVGQLEAVGTFGKHLNPARHLDILATLLLDHAGVIDRDQQAAVGLEGVLVNALVAVPDQHEVARRLAGTPARIGRARGERGRAAVTR